MPRKFLGFRARKTSRFDRRLTVGQLARTVKNIKRKVARVKPEIKYLDKFNAAAFATAGTIVQLSGIAQGSGDTQRIGHQVRLKALRFAAECTNSTTNDTAFSTIRVIVFMDKNDNFVNGSVVTPVIGDVLDTSVITNPAFAYVPWDNTDRIKIIYDSGPRTFGSKGSGTSPVSPQKYDLKWSKKLNKVLTFSQGQVTGENQIYLLTIIDSYTTGAPAYNIGTRIEFTDA